MKADKLTLIEFVNSDMGGNVTIQIDPDQSFPDQYVARGQLTNDSTDGSYVAGHLFPSTIQGEFQIDGSNILTSSSLATHPQGGNVFSYKDVQKNRYVMNHACVMIAAPSASVDIYVSHARPDISTVKSTRRKITLTASTTTLQII